VNPNSGRKRAREKKLKKRRALGGLHQSEKGETNTKDQRTESPEFRRGGGGKRETTGRERPGVSKGNLSRVPPKGTKKKKKGESVNGTKTAKRLAKGEKKKKGGRPFEMQLPSRDLEEMGHG